MLNLKLFIVIITFILAAKISFAQQEPVKFSFDSKVKQQTVKKISNLLDENYIFPDLAKKMGTLIKQNLAAGSYDGIDDPMKFAETLTADLQSVSNDKHIRVRFSPEDAKRLIEQEKNGSDTDDEKHWNEMMKKENYGFKKVERLPGNIGYVDFRNFASPDYSKETVASVMKFLENTDAIIFDLRLNGGGDPAGVQLMCSYLFTETPVHLNDLYYRPTDETKEYWTLRKIDGKRMPDVPVYVLTSKFTFSGAEEFSYNLKNLKRATIVGETTGGGAHPGGVRAINEGFAIFVPNGRAINPITKTNWEGVGVEPDVNIKSELALEQAQILALQKLTQKSKDEQQIRTYNWMVESLNALLNAPTIDENTLKSYAGTYDDRTITYEAGKLYYQRKGRQKYAMTPMTEDTFMFKDLEYFRLKFVKDDSGTVIEVNGLYDNGHVDKSKRTN
ncbi:MAG: S41 family peptidase [Ignavibacteria bacterium]|nr:S41 family peptidase [Ignavibacteria bacterium]